MAEWMEWRGVHSKGVDGQQDGTVVERKMQDAACCQQQGISNVDFKNTPSVAIEASVGVKETYQSQRQQTRRSPASRGQRAACCSSSAGIQGKDQVGEQGEGSATCWGGREKNSKLIRTYLNGLHACATLVHAAGKGGALGIHQTLGGSLQGERRRVRDRRTPGGNHQRSAALCSTHHVCLLCVYVSGEEGEDVCCCVVCVGSATR